MGKLFEVPLPLAWTGQARSGVLHALAAAHFVMTHVRGWCLDSRIHRVRLAAERDIALSRLAALEEEGRLLRARLEHVVPQRRPHYPPTARLAILALRAASGWTIAETAQRFQVSEQTIAHWMRRLDDEGEDALVLVKMPEPVNRYPDFVRQLVVMLGATFPALGKVRIADTLARAGLHLAASTVARMRKARPDDGDRTPRATDAEKAPNAVDLSRVTARYPHHVWHVDLTLLPIVTGLWLPWIPQALVQRWPFAFWLGAVLDHPSRAVAGWRLFLKEPTSAEVLAMLDAARRRHGATPRYVISDRGVQFRSEYLAWCARSGIRPRFGAVGRSGSIAIIERFFRSLKDEMLRRLVIVPMSVVRMRREVELYVGWYNEERPHRGLGGHVPAEILRGLRRARDRPSWEVRKAHPLARRKRRLKGRLVLVADRVGARAHLPVVRLDRAA